MARPILANSSARATSAAEARFRIGRVQIPARATRVIALDDGAVPLVERVSRETWASSRFFIGARDADPGQASAADGSDLVVRSPDGHESSFADELDGVDVVMMVATVAYRSGLADRVGGACASRSIMIAGVVIGGWQETTQVVAALRPYARVLIITREDADVQALLTAFRA